MDDIFGDAPLFGEIVSVGKIFLFTFDGVDRLPQRFNIGRRLVLPVNR